jgi:hypothetical protein
LPSSLALVIARPVDSVHLVQLVEPVVLSSHEPVLVDATLGW